MGVPLDNRFSMKRNSIMFRNIKLASAVALISMHGAAASTKPSVAQILGDPIAGAIRTVASNYRKNPSKALLINIGIMAESIKKYPLPAPDAHNYVLRWAAQEFNRCYYQRKKDIVVGKDRSWADRTEGICDGSILAAEHDAAILLVGSNLNSGPKLNKTSSSLVPALASSAPSFPPLNVLLNQNDTFAIALKADKKREATKPNSIMAGVIRVMEKASKTDPLPHLDAHNYPLAWLNQEYKRCAAVDSYMKTLGLPAPSRDELTDNCRGAAAVTLARSQKKFAK